MRARLTRAITALAFLAFCAAAALPQAGYAGGQSSEFVLTDFDGSADVALMKAALQKAALQDAPERLLLRVAGNHRAITDPAAAAGMPGPAAACDKLTASTPASWYATDSDGNVNTDAAVDNYPSGTLVIAPGFSYTCAPKDSEVVIIIYNQAYGTDPALVEKRTIQASATGGTFFYALTTPDDTALQDGKWRVAFYQGKTPISTGEILLGGAADVDTTKQAVVQGTVLDQRTGQPVVDARILVLNPGVTVEDFARETRREDIFVQTRTDEAGQFSLWKPLERNTQYAMLIAASGYKLRGTNRLIIGDQAASPVDLGIKLVQH